MKRYIVLVLTARCGSYSASLTVKRRESSIGSGKPTPFQLIRSLAPPLKKILYSQWCRLVTLASLSNITPKALPNQRTCRSLVVPVTIPGGGIHDARRPI